ncbi:hypothetical protein N8T08_005491 [Aspergillus melleus]|uniref:Uncharacterized protein n=1 Tax=Aspergillus melleus TaxID=138277 RepID=A0ACC3B2B1_9EURO|nr:hypothetical protein N8T08_005491 [Aspergillus melleus]
MEVAGLVLTVVGTLDICIKYGTQLKATYKAIKHLETDVEEMCVTILGALLKSQAQLDSLKSIWTTLDPNLQDHFADAVTRLKLRLLGSLGDLKQLKEYSRAGSSTPDKLKAVYLKKHVKKAVSDIEEWQARFDPSWYLISRISDSVIDRQLATGLSQDNPSSTRLARMREAIRESSSESHGSSSVFKSPDTISSIKTRIVDINTFTASYTDDGRPVILDQTNYLSATAAGPRLQVRDLARLLRNVNHKTFSLLRCSGVIDVSDDTQKQYQFILEVPRGLVAPMTLRSLLQHQPRCSLNLRFQLAKQLARSVMFVHTIGFVHKGIRPETVLVFADAQDPSEYRHSYLIGFERSRRAVSPTDYAGDLEWERNLYRHPVRQGQWPEELFVMQHDIYSLGVCLLELALWTSFVQSDRGEDSDASVRLPWPELDIASALADKDLRRGAFAIKDRFVELAQDRLPSLVGLRYTEVTVACLCCLDDGEDNVFGGEVDRVDQDGIVVGVRFIEKV